MYFRTKLSHSQSSSQLQHELQSSAPTTPAPTDDMLPPLGDDLLENSVSTYGYDPNEPRYCTCNDVSWGEMVGCDNSDVSIKRWWNIRCGTIYRKESMHVYDLYNSFIFYSVLLNGFTMPVLD